jgi:hypothetical protein
VARQLLLASVTLGALALGGCREETEPPGLPPPRQTPVDTTLPGELAEGTEVAFGLKLPRDLEIEARFDDAVIAVGRVPLEYVANYVRDRVDSDRVETGPSRTVFDEASPKADAQKTVRIEVTRRARGDVQLVVRDRTPKPMEEGLTEAERYKKAGLAPDGKTVLPEQNQ